MFPLFPGNIPQKTGTRHKTAVRGNSVSMSCSLYYYYTFLSGLPLGIFLRSVVVTSYNCAVRRSDDEYDEAIGTLLSVGGSVLRVLGERILDTYSGATQVSREGRWVMSNVI